MERHEGTTYSDALLDRAEEQYNNRGKWWKEVAEGLGVDEDMLIKKCQERSEERRRRDREKQTLLKDGRPYWGPSYLDPRI